MGWGIVGEILYWTSDLIIDGIAAIWPWGNNNDPGPSMSKKQEARRQRKFKRKQERKKQRSS